MDCKKECERRLTNLYYESHEWLLKAAFNVTKDIHESEDIVSELYVYLGTKCNPKIFWKDNSYNLLYLHQFIKHRWYNKVSKNKVVNFSSIQTEQHFNRIPDSEYDIELDIAIMKSYDEVLAELKRLETTRLWPKAKLYSLYWMSDDSLNQVAKKIGISGSTTFIAIKTIREHLKKTITNPFKD
jgi:DNA-directed RNA polymerase specialized sigma24 family protein